MRRTINIDAALTDRNLLGAALGNEIASWSRWLSVLRAAFALPMSADDLANFKIVAGDRAPPLHRVGELWCVVSRRSGKTRMAAAISTYIGAIEQHKLAVGAVRNVVGIRAARSPAM
jgi:hypothetical protein